MNYVRQTPTEECPLTKERKECSLSDCCGFRTIICSFVALTAIITAALMLQLIYDSNAFQGKLNIHGGVATDYTNCSQIGTKLLSKGGNAVDAAAAATICMAVVAPHKTSLGSGGYIMIYSHKNQEKPVLIDFLNNTVSDEFKKFEIRIPAMLRGLEYAHTMYGQLPWHEIVEPSIKLAKTGFLVSRDFAYEATKNPNLGTFSHIDAGKNQTLPDLADTLEAVSKFGANVFYNGTLTSKIFSSKAQNQKLLNELANYKPKIIEVQKSKLSKYAIFYPSTLNYVQPIIEKINNLNTSQENASSTDSEITAADAVIKLIHQLKNPHINYTEIRRFTGVASVDWQDVYVSVVTGLSEPLDVTYKTEAGFVFDNISNKNSILSLIPIIFYDETVLCGLRGVFGVDDPIIAAQILYNLLLRSMNASAAVEYPRYYLFSDGVAIENDDRYSVSKLLQSSLQTIDTTSKVDPNTIMKSVNVITKEKNLINGHSDSRGDGYASRF